MATAEELRRLREEQSIFSALYDMARQQQSELAAEGRRPVLGGLLSKEPVYGTDTLRYEGIGNMLAGLLSPAAKAVDAPISAYRGTIPQEDMISEALGVGGLAMAGGGAVGVPRGAVAANASKSAGLLPAAASEAQDMAKRILELRAQGRASEVTDEMMAQADPQYMFANTPLPMDEASRMARAEAAGFGVGSPVFHGGASGIKAMDADVSEGKDFDTGVWTTSDRYNANRYAGSRTEGAPKINDQQNWSIYDDRGSVYPLLAKTSGYGETNFRGRNWGDAPEGAIIRGGGQPSQRISEVREDWRAWPYTSEAVRAARDTGRSGLVIKDVVDIGPNFPHKDHIGLGSEISDDVVAIDPSTLRSRFARFDPEFSHLSNLSAANASPLGGLLAQSGVSDKQAERIEEYLRRRGLLD